MNILNLEEDIEQPQEAHSRGMATWTHGATSLDLHCVAKWSAPPHLRHRLSASQIRSNTSLFLVWVRGPFWQNIDPLTFSTPYFFIIIKVSESSQNCAWYAVWGATLWIYPYFLVHWDPAPFLCSSKRWERFDVEPTYHLPFQLKNIHSEEITSILVNRCMTSRDGMTRASTSTTALGHSNSIVRQ